MRCSRQQPYVYAEWRRCRAGIDYHVEVYGHWYSVPSRLMRDTTIGATKIDAQAPPRVEFIDENGGGAGVS